MPPPIAPPAREDTVPRAVEAALLLDLAVVPALARALPVGGLPRAGLLAQHCYVLCDALAHDLDYRARVAGVSHPEGAATASGTREAAANRAATEDALEAVIRRLERLYSADRPGGLDRIDEHLARLYRAIRANYKSSRLDASEPASHRDRTWAGHGPDDDDGSWWQGMDHRQRARIAAWLITAVGDPGRSIFRSQPLVVRTLVRLRYQRQAQMRRRRLGLNLLAMKAK